MTLLIFLVLVAAFAALGLVVTRYPDGTLDIFAKALGALVCAMALYALWKIAEDISESLLMSLSWMNVWTYVQTSSGREGSTGHDALLTPDVTGGRQ